MTFGRTSDSRPMVLSRLAICSRLRSSWPDRLPVTPDATMREKCNETPFGTSAIISGSRVGLPGGTRKPRRDLQPIMVICSLLTPMSDIKCDAENQDQPRPMMVILHPNSAAGANMERRKLLMAGASVATGMFASQALAQTVQSLPDRFAAALSAHDIKAFADLFAEDYVNHQVSAAAPPPP